MPRRRAMRRNLAATRFLSWAQYRTNLCEPVAPTNILRHGSASVRPGEQSPAARYAIHLTPAKHPDQEKPAPRVSAVVVSHNRSALLRRCLASLEASEGRDRLQVIVIDNGSHDGSAQWDGEFPKVQFIRLPKNFGLTKAMNIGWRAADAPYV